MCFFQNLQMPVSFLRSIGHHSHLQPPSINNNNNNNRSLHQLSTFNTRNNISISTNTNICNSNSRIKCNNSLLREAATIALNIEQCICLRTQLKNGPKNRLVKHKSLLLYYNNLGLSNFRYASGSWLLAWNLTLPCS